MVCSTSVQVALEPKIFFLMLGNKHGYPLMDIRSDRIEVLWQKWLLLGKLCSYTRQVETRRTSESEVETSEYIYMLNTILKCWVSLFVERDGHKKGSQCSKYGSFRLSTVWLDLFGFCYMVLYYSILFVLYGFVKSYGLKCEKYMEVDAHQNVSIRISLNLIPFR